MTDVLDETEKPHDVTTGAPASDPHDVPAAENVFAPTEAEVREGAEWADDDYIAEQQSRRAAEALDETEADDIKPLEDVSDEEAASPQVPSGKDLPRNWYILKVQSNREDSIADALKRRVKVAGMDSYFDEIIVP